MLKTLVILTIIASVLFPVSAAAQGLVPCGATAPGSQISREPCTLQHAIDLTINIINLAIQAAGMIAVLIIMIGGYQMIAAGLTGNPENYQKGKKTVFNAILGIFIILISYVIVNSIMSLITTGTFAGGDSTWTRPWR